MLKPIYIIGRTKRIGQSNGFNVFVKNGYFEVVSSVEPIAYDERIKAHEQCLKLIEDFKKSLMHENIEIVDWHASRENYYIIYCIGGSELHHVEFNIREILLLNEDL